MNNNRYTLAISKHHKRGKTQTIKKIHLLHFGFRWTDEKEVKRSTFNIALERRNLYLLVPSRPHKKKIASANIISIAKAGLVDEQSVNHN